MCVMGFYMVPELWRFLQTSNIAQVVYRWLEGAIRSIKAPVLGTGIYIKQHQSVYIGCRCIWDRKRELALGVESVTVVIPGGC
jgi:hypothetical protein